MHVTLCGHGGAQNLVPSRPQHGGDAQRMVRTVLGTPGRAGHRVDAVPGELHLLHSLALVPGGLVVATGQGLVRAGF